MSPNALLDWLRRRCWVVAALALVTAGCVYLASSAIQDGRDRRRARARIEFLAEQIAITTRAIDDATSPEARAAGDARLAGAIAELRRSIDCAALYVNDERPAACVAVSTRMDAIRAGEDPFARPPTTTGGNP